MPDLGTWGFQRHAVSGAAGDYHRMSQWDLCGDPQVCVVKGVTTNIWLQNAGFIWVPFIVASTIAAWFGMNDIASAKASFKDQAVIFRRKHNWLMCWLYLGTFGSFIGFAAGFALLIKKLFPADRPDPVRLPWPAGRRHCHALSAAGSPTN